MKHDSKVFEYCDDQSTMMILTFINNIECYISKNNASNIHNIIIIILKFASTYRR